MRSADPEGAEAVARFSALKGSNLLMGLCDQAKFRPRAEYQDSSLLLFDVGNEEDRHDRDT
jgi:hypothetical protein